MKYWIYLLFIVFNIHCKTQNKITKFFDKQGHRGARGLYPENTIVGFIGALQYPITTLELDVVMTKDSVIICSHEGFISQEICLDKEGNSIEDTKKVKIIDLNFDDIVKYDCGTKNHPRFLNQKKIFATKPALYAVFDSVEAYIKKNKLNEVNYNIEAKFLFDETGPYQPDVEFFIQSIIDLIQQKKLENRVTIQSFYVPALRYLHRNYPCISLSYLTVDIHFPDKQFKILGFMPKIYSPYYKNVNKNLIDSCHNYGIKIIPWTVNDFNEMIKLRDIGTDGIISDYPNLFEMLD